MELRQEQVIFVEVRLQLPEQGVTPYFQCMRPYTEVLPKHDARPYNWVKESKDKEHKLSSRYTKTSYNA